MKTNGSLRFRSLAEVDVMCYTCSLKTAHILPGVNVLYHPWEVLRHSSTKRAALVALAGS